jgi:hypothetical protein
MLLSCGMPIKRSTLAVRAAQIGSAVRYKSQNPDGLKGANDFSPRIWPTQRIVSRPKNFLQFVSARANYVRRAKPAGIARPARAAHNHGQ